MPNKRICFLICPIGGDGTEIRKQSDDLLDLVIIPALQPYNFEVVRADKIPRPSIITSDIIHLVQNSVLCIIDLTGSNPNVFYECGRRHETGKPFIQVIKKGERLPFDVAGIRTIEYDLSSARTARDSTIAIQNFIEEMNKIGFQTDSSGESLSTIANRLERIERKLSDLSSQKTFEESTEDVDPLEKIKFQYNPTDYFMRALDRGDADTAREAVIKMYQRKIDPNDILIAAAILAALGDEATFDIVDKVLKESGSKIIINTWLYSIDDIRKTYLLKQLAKECFDLIMPLLNVFIVSDETNNEDKAILLNTISILQSNFQDYENAIINGKKVIELQSNLSVYYYNLALIYDDQGMKEQCLEMLDQYTVMDSKQLTKNFLVFALETYQKYKLTDEAKRVYNLLKSVDAVEARKYATSFRE